MHLIKHCEHANGNAHVAVDLACAQAECGSRVTFVSGGGVYEPLLRDAGVDHRRIPHDERRPAAFVHAIWETLRLVRRQQPDVLHAHMMSSAILGFAVASLTGTPLVTTVHNSFDRHSFLMALGHRIVAVSRAERELLARRGFNDRRLVVVVNGPNGSRRETFLSQTGNASLRNPCVTTVCGLHPRKGVSDLIKAFAVASRDMPHWRLYIAGEGPARPALESLARDLDLQSRAIFLGSVPSGKSVLEHSDVCVLASHAEPFGLVLAEARAAGCAIIGTDVGGIPELLEFGRAGKLTPPGDPDRLADCLRLVMTDHVERERLRRAAREGAEYFNIERVAADYGEIYRTVRVGRAG